MTDFDSKNESIDIDWVADFDFYTQYKVTLCGELIIA